MGDNFASFRQTSYWPQLKAVMREICDKMGQKCLDEDGDKPEAVVGLQREHKGARRLYGMVVGAVELEEAPAADDGMVHAEKFTKQELEGFLYNQIVGA